MRLLAILLAAAVISAAAAATDKAKPGADKDKLICKREIPIGSLIATRKVCLTQAQWTQRIEDGNRETRRLMEENTTRQRSN
jgi:Spy/CpxP family protein refolding chaperone